MATIFWLLMGYTFGCMIACDMLFGSWGWVFGIRLSDEDIAKIEVQRDIAMATFWQPFFGFLYTGCTLAPPSEYD